MLTLTQFKKIKAEAKAMADATGSTYQQQLEVTARERGYRSFNALRAAVTDKGNSDYPQLASEFDRMMCGLSESLDGYRDVLQISTRGTLAEVYAPFDYLERNAKVAIVGLTPGDSQAVAAIRAFREARTSGSKLSDSLRTAKLSASFGGPMRRNLIHILEHAGVPDRVGVSGAAALFDSASTLCHFTSILRYPIFKDGANYSGTPAPTDEEWLWQKVSARFLPEYRGIPGALWIPLGVAVQKAVQKLITQGVVDEGQVLTGLPHPSGANMGRISRFLSEPYVGQVPAKHVSVESITDAVAESSAEKPRPAIATAAQPRSPKVKDFSRLFHLEHQSGDKLYPVRVKNRDTGRMTFRLSKGGAGGNTKESGVEMDSEQDMRRYVIDRGYAVRAATLNRSRTGLYKPASRSIVRLVEEGTVR